MDSTIAGFWGNRTATIDWCEKNYEVTYYIAEFCMYRLLLTLRKKFLNRYFYTLS